VIQPRRRLAAALLALSIALPARAADELTLHPTYDLATDAAVTGVAVGGTLALLLLKDQLAPATCRWCTPPGFDADVSRSLAWSNRDAAGTASDVLEVVLGAGVLGTTILDGQRRGGSELAVANSLLVAEATSIAMLLNTGVKYAVGRSRPYVYFGGGGADTRDGNLSFFSGHTTFAFAVAASSSTLLLSQHAPHAEWVSAGAFATAGFIGYLRIAADQHYLTDVLAGAAVGTAVGWAVPHFFHPAHEKGMQVRPAPGGLAIAW
jgi:PAP2 superfamily protein